MELLQNSSIKALIVVLLIFWVWYTWDEPEYFVVNTPANSPSPAVNKPTTVLSELIPSTIINPQLLPSHNLFTTLNPAKLFS